MGFIAATEMGVEVNDKKEGQEEKETRELKPTFEIHTLVLHKRWRAMRLTVVLSSFLIAHLTSISFSLPLFFSLSHSFSYSLSFPFPPCPSLSFHHLFFSLFFIFM